MTSMMKIISIILTLLSVSFTGKSKFIRRTIFDILFQLFMVLHHAMHVMIVEQHGMYPKLPLFQHPMPMIIVE